MLSVSSPIIPSLERAWRHALIRLVLVGVVVGLGFPDTWTDMARVWLASETFGHGAAVLPISVWLLWKSRAVWMSRCPEASWLGLPIVMLGAMAWLAAELAGVSVVAQYAALSILVGLIITCVGPALARQIRFPLVFLFFMVPAGEWLNGPLMEGTASATIAAVSAFGIPVFRDGMFFSLPTGQWSVVEACSGLRYVLVSAMLGVLFAYLNFRSLSRQIVFIAAALTLAVVANWMRAALIVAIGHLSDMRWGTGEDHVWYGWAFFGVVMFGLFWMGARWREEAVPESEGKPQDPSRDPTRSSAIKVFPGRTTSLRAANLTVLLGLLTTLAAPVLAHRLMHVTPRLLEPALQSAALKIEPLSTLQIPVSVRGARGVLSGQDPAHEGLELTLAYFADQSAGHEMIAHGNGLPSTTPGWTRTSVTQTHWVGSGARMPIRVLSYRSSVQPQELRHVLLFYVVSERVLATETAAKFQTAWALLRGRGDHSMLVAVSVPGSLFEPTSPDRPWSDAVTDLLDRTLRVARAATAAD